MNTFNKFIFLFFALILSTFEGAAPLKEDLVKQLQPKLNSDRIEYFFGSYGIETLDIHSPSFLGSRIANLYSLHQDNKVMRTLAIVDFQKQMSPNLQDAHLEITNGASIGITLRNHGWTIHKRHMYFGETPLSTKLMHWMNESTTDNAAIHIYLLEVSKEDTPTPLPYCTIIEIHNPQYLSTEWLQALYENEYNSCSITTDAITALFCRLETLIRNFPETL